jgi:hypothetical protein
MVLTLLFALQSAQLLQYGVKGGLTLTSDEDRKYFEGQGGESSIRVNRGTIGPYLELRPLRKLPSVETGFLYRRLRTDSYYGPFPNVSLNYIVRTASTFDIPLLLKVRSNAWFASAGSTIRRIGDLDQYYRQVPLFPGFPPSETRLTVPKEDRFRYGITFSGGRTMAVGPLKLEPELRFTRWTALRETPRQNQIDLLLGVRF